ncbi:nitroreductase/quinone reductase family protein [Candidatus Poriferisodalis sp.]|uniref:nitroreductase/quinone reductase family protein n=1 Tax=Candidatus Poriferisodalis sp. TaxID=3101277 RepID=UPI003B01CAD9
MAVNVWSDFTFKLANWANRTAIRCSGGRIGWIHKGTPIIEVTMMGRRSGEPRTTLLSAVAERDGAFVVIGSRGGDSKHPAWFLNMRDNPAVTVRNRDGTRQMTARLTEGDERAELWAHATAKDDHYLRFQARTDRQFPIVMLEPADDVGAGGD